MSEFLFQYEKVDPVSWAYLASLLLVGLFFKFNRFWSVRNLDLVLLILLAPGLLMVHEGQRQERQVYESLRNDANLKKPSINSASGERTAAAREGSSPAAEMYLVVHQVGVRLPEPSPVIGDEQDPAEGSSPAIVP